MIYFLLGIIVLLIITVIILFLNRIKIETINKKEEIEYKEKLEQLNKDYQNLKEKFSNAENLFAQNLKIKEQFLTDEYERNKTKLQEESLQLRLRFNQEKLALISQSEEEKENLLIEIQNFKKQREAIIEQQKKEEQGKSEIKFYKIELSENEIQDIDKILQVTKILSNPQTLYKLIWSEYYQKPLKDLILRVIGDKQISGIYKITNLKNGKIYIGRSTNIGERWIQHIKSSLEIGTIAKTQLYKEMKDYGIENFSFEVVEQCDKNLLGQREKFYISLYKTNEWGLNENAGG